MQLKHKVLPLLLMKCLLLLSCSKGDEDRQQGPLRIPLEGEPSARFSEVFEKIEYQPIQLPERQFIGGVDKAIVKDQRLYVFDYLKAQSLFVFELDGSFLFSINAVGQGPGEFQRPVDYLVDDEYIEILDITGKVIVFDLKGRFVREFSLPVNANKFIKLSSNDYILYTKESSNTTYGTNVDCDLLLYNVKTEKKDCLLGRNGPAVPFFQERNNVFVSSDEALFSKMFLDTIYLVKDKTVSPEFVLDFGQNAFPTDRLDPAKNSYENIINTLNSNANKLYHMPELFSNQEFVITRYNHTRLHYLFVDKATGFSKSLKVGTDNDLDGGTPFLVVHAIDKNQVLALVDSNYFLDIYYQKQQNKDMKVGKRFLELAGKMDINDPPVLVKYSLRSPSQWPSE